MPVIKQAAKKLRHDRKRTRENEKIRYSLDRYVNKARKSPSEKTLTVAFSALDKATKQRIIHKNAAARTKARLAKLLKK